jgi:glycerol-3-phosphate dehydrogenase subunit B
MSARRVIVLGAGVAGTAAAFAASEAGAEVVLLSAGAGSSSLMSGAADYLPWEQDDTRIAPQPLAPELHALLDAMQLWSVAEDRKVVATCAGLLRPARGADRALLNLAELQGQRVAVPRLARGSWDADLLVRGWSASPWALRHGVSFEAVDAGPLLGEAEALASDADLALLTDRPERVAHLAARLREATEGFGAALTGPWLGVTTDAAAMLTEAVGKPVGETLSALSGAAGARFEAASERVLDALQRVSGHARALERDGAGWLVRHDGGELRAQSVVVASGGMVGAGLRFTPSEAEEAGEWPGAGREPFALSFTAPLWLAIDGRVLASPGSLHGPNLEDCGWPDTARQRALFERVGVHHHQGRALERDGTAIVGVLVAGSAASGAAHTVLASAEAGLRAGREAALGPQVT